MLKEKGHKCRASLDYMVSSYLKRKQEINKPNCSYNNSLMDTKYAKYINYDINTAKG